MAAVVAPTTQGCAKLRALLQAVQGPLDSYDVATISARAAGSVPGLAPGASAGAVALATPDGRVTLTGGGTPGGSEGAPGQLAWDTGPAAIPGAATLRRGRVWQPGGGPVQGVLLPAGWPVPVLGVPLRRDGHLRGALYALNAAGTVLPPEQRARLEVFAACVATALDRADLHEETAQAQRGLARMMSITAGIAQRLDFSTIAQRIVDGLTAVTDFRCAAMTLRDGDSCRRLAASGLAEPRIGLQTPFARWRALLREEWRRGDTTYLIPPEAPADWSDLPDLPAASDDPDAWTAGHGLVILLRDHDAETVGFLSVDEPRSQRLPDDRTVEHLELFAAQVEVALVNARAYSALRDAAERDALTGLRNRRACWEDLEPAIGKAAAAAPITIALVDLDDFKAVNDRHGHAVGDLTLRHVADRLARSVRETDRVYRVGGEEFVIALPGTCVEDALGVLERVRTGVQRMRVDLPAVTLSIGLAQAPMHGTSMDGLYKTADDALYAAKGSGKDKIVLAGAPPEGGPPAGA